MMGRNDIKRIILLGALFFIGLQLWAEWQHDQVAKTAAVQQQVVAKTDQATHVPIVPTESAQQTTPTAVPVIGNKPVTLTPQHRIVSVTTDVLHVDIDSLGGNIVNAKLREFPKTLHSLTPFTLLNDIPDTLYLAQSGLTGKQGPDTPDKLAQYRTKQTSYILTPEQNTVTVDLEWQANGVSITKSYIFTRGKYAVDVRYSINNKSSKPWQGHLYTQLQHKPKKAGSMFLGLHTFTGAAISTEKNRYNKLSYGSLDKHNINVKSKGGWLAFQQHYFLSAWVPPAGQTNQFYSHVNQGVYTVGAIGPALTVAPNTTLEQTATLYSGPESAERLEKIAPNLDLTIDYGIFWVISSALFWLMRKIHLLVNNWGWSIVLLTLLVRLVFYKLSVISYRSMGRMRLLQPKIKTLKERCGDDKQKFSKSIMELYRKEKVNPLSGCLPILIQIPVFIGLYWVLIESVELRQAPWILWIHDLSAKDPFYILPLLMGLTMFLQQKLSPPPPDPMQAKMMMMLPVVFTVLFLYFPAGLVLYWVTNNTVSILQQWYIMRKLDLEQKKGSYKSAKKHLPKSKM